MMATMKEIQAKVIIIIHNFCIMQILQTAQGADTVVILKGRTCVAIHFVLIGFDLQFASCLNGH